jgi:AcrR family transcriptional regulator
MGPRPVNVKASAGGKRPYDATRRQERAARNRTAIVDAAERRFLRDGYAATTVAAIAADAGVSDHTIYKAFGGKPGLIRAIRVRALEGTGPVPAEQRSDELDAGAQKGRAIIEGWGRLTAEVMPRVAPVLLLIRDAATSDPEVRDLLTELDADRLRRMTDNAGRLAAAGHLRPDLTVADAAEVLWTYTAPELYELLVLRRRWSPGRYAEFAVDAMIHALL